MTDWNLPPGVTVSMLPGNRPEDIAWQRFVEAVEAETDWTEEEVERFCDTYWDDYNDGTPLSRLFDYWKEAQ